MTATSSARDELRDRVSRYVQVADEEQLREMALAFERCGIKAINSNKNNNNINNINNNSAALLLQLPYELLEYMAEAYFARGEAARVVTISKSFHQLFIKSVWRSIDLEDYAVNDRRVTLETLEHNGDKVRHLNLKSLTEACNISSVFPHLSQITFTIRRNLVSMFEKHLEHLRNLDRVVLDVTPDSAWTAAAAADWINDSKRSGHVKSIWIQCLDPDGAWINVQESMSILLSNIENMDRIRINSETAGSLLPSQVAEHVPSTLVRLMMSDSPDDGCAGTFNGRVFGGESNDVFVHLRELFIQPCCNNPAVYDYRSFTPERFPALRDLKVVLFLPVCNTQYQRPFTTIFSKSWPLVTNFQLFSHGGAEVQEINTILQALPNVQTGMFYDMNLANLDGTSLPRHIRELTFDRCVINNETLVNKTPFVTKLEFYEHRFTRSDVEFMVSCSRLTEVEFNICILDESCKEWIFKCPKSTARKVTVVDNTGDYYNSKLDKMLQLFTDIKFLDIRDVSSSRKLDYVRQCPRVQILA
ncbi:hypothetical protein GQ42DRAFT_163470 [Ramicandelaber brevisporus]|nr:hypothetical protein GQ42DRAFT_163470 [Ramicandelaber brevisporus]